MRTPEPKGCLLPDIDGLLLHARAYPLCMLSVDDIACITQSLDGYREYSLISQHLSQQASKGPHITGLKTCGDRGDVMEGRQELRS